MQDRREFLRKAIVTAGIAATGEASLGATASNQAGSTGQSSADLPVNTKAQAMIDQSKIKPQGQWYEATVPDTLDFARQGELSVNVMTRNVEPTKFYSVYQGFALRPTGGPNLGGLTWNINPKNARALPWLRTMSGSELNMDVEYKMMRDLVGQISADGQLYVPVDTDSVPKGTSNPVLSGLLAMAIGNWYERDQNPGWLALLGQLSTGMQKIALNAEDRSYYPLECGYRSDGTWHYERRQGKMLLPYKPPDEPLYDQQGVEGATKFYGGVPFRALALAYRMNHDDASLQMAKRQARYLLKPTMWVDTKDQGYPGHEHGIFEGHFHGNIGPLMSLFDLALLENNAWLKEFVREGYDHAVRQGVVRMGWFPSWTYPAPNSPWREGRKPEHHHVRTELCGVSDTLMLAMKLTDAGMGDYWEDIDHIARNMLVAQQFESLDLMRKCVGNDPKHDEVLSRFVGGFGSAGPSYNRPAVHGCCSANGAMGLYYAWHGITRFDQGIATVNLFLNRASTWMDVDSYLPYEGKVVLRNKQARSAHVRVPAWVETSKLKTFINGRETRAARAGSYLIFDTLKKGDEIRLEFPVPTTVDKYTIAGKQYTLTFRGSTMVDISPRDPYPNSYPIFQRDALKATSAPVKKVRRFASARVLALQ